MPRLAVAIAILSALFAMAEANRFSTYKPLEAYVLEKNDHRYVVMPRYAADGQVCGLGFEKLHYSPEIVDVDPGMDLKEIDQVLDQLVPASERGASHDNIGALVTQQGPAMTETRNYENVWILIYGGVRSQSKKGIVGDLVAAEVRWKNRECK